MVELHGDALDADIIKYPHHGIEELVPEYQAAVTPLFMVITNNHRQTAGWKWITGNKNTIPYDTESPFKTSGIRVGTASVTTRGMKEAEMIKIGTWIADVLDNIADTSVQERVKREAKELVAKFPVP